MADIETAPRGRGRPRAFDEDQVLDALVELFWEQGFEAASMTEIVDAAGLNKSSLYNAFGSKDELFFLVLDRYLERRRDALFEGAGDGGVDAVLGFLDMVRSELVSDGGARGCLAVNSTTELGLRDPRIAEVSARYQAMMHDVFRRPLRTAADVGEIDPTLVEPYVATLSTAMLGLSVAARGGTSSAELHTTIDSIAALVQSWKR